MWGVYAARCFHKGSRVLVYVGEEIRGASRDEMVNKFVQRVRKGGGRHVMEIGRGRTARLVDGIDGYTGAQFVNSAYNAPSAYSNNVRVGESGTGIAMKNIKQGDEILFAVRMGMHIGKDV